MDNPYEAPSTRPLGKESRRDLWRRQLVCPHCGKPGISAGVAYLAHPVLKVRCHSCRERSMVRLTGAARKRFVALVWMATIMIAATITLMGLVDPIAIYDFIDHVTPWMRETLSFENQMRIVLIGMVAIAVIPLLALLSVAARFSLRDVAYYSTLRPVKKSQPS